MRPEKFLCGNYYTLNANMCSGQYDKYQPLHLHLPQNLLYFSRLGAHQRIELCVLREIVNERHDVLAALQKPFAESHGVDITELVIRYVE